MQAHTNPAPLYRRDAGQASVLLLLMLSTFMLGVLAFAVDLTGMWFHRQSAQSAADSACLAGASDMLALTSNVTTSVSGFTPGTASNCASSPSAPLCKYAGFNGYAGTGLSTTAVSNSVSWTFPSSVTSATAPANVTHPFLKVTVTENVKTYLMGLLGKPYQQVSATASCGTVGIVTDPPVTVLDQTDSGTISTNGNPVLKITGGPSRSIQVNSSSATAVTSSGSTGIDTSTAGPNGTGGDVSVYGAESSPPGTASLGTGTWVAKSFPLPDPYANVPAPTTPSNAPGSARVNYQFDACPDVNGCDEYSPGYYPSQLKVQGTTAIFLPGVYVLNNGLSLDSNSIARNAFLNQTSPVLSTNGVMFYLKGGAVSVAANSGNRTGVDTIPASMTSCDGSVPAGVPSGALSGSVLMAQCVSDGTYTTDGGTGSYSSTGSRGLIFFESHTNTTSPIYSAQGGGGLLFAGTEYFHSSTPGIMSFGGNPSGTTYMVGYIITDEIALSGNAGVTMVLPPLKLATTLKIALLQ